MPTVDVVVVAYNSRDHLRDCVAGLCADARIRVIVVDNASPSDDLEVLDGLEVTAIRRSTNGGFAVACNEGWLVGDSPFVLFLNPDAVFGAAALFDLVGVLERDSSVGIAGPKIIDFDGRLVHSQRRYLDVKSVWAQAFFLHHVFPRAAWTDGTVRAPEAYAAPGRPEWVSGACLLVRRPTLERLGGFDDRFFMYCEDQDLCRRCRALGQQVHFEPSAVARHVGGASAPRAALFHVLVESRACYLSIYSGRLGAALGRAGLAAGEFIRVAITRGGAEDRAGHLRGLRAAVGLLGTSSHARHPSRPDASSAVDETSPTG